MAKRKFNFELMERIIVQIEANPEKFEMGSWWAVAPEATDDELVRDNLNPAASCGTTGCIAGWAIALAYPKAKAKAYSYISMPHANSFCLRTNGPTVDIADRAGKLLGLTEGEASTMFGGSGWPAPYGPQIEMLTYRYGYDYDKMLRTRKRRSYYLKRLAANRAKQAALAVQYLRSFVQEKMGQLV